MLLDVSDLKGSQYSRIAWGEMTWVVLLSMSDSIATTCATLRYFDFNKFHLQVVLVSATSIISKLIVHVQRSNQQRRDGCIQKPPFFQQNSSWPSPCWLPQGQMCEGTGQFRTSASYHGMIQTARWWSITRLEGGIIVIIGRFQVLVPLKKMICQ